MKNIHVLATNKPSRIYLIKSINKLGITSNNPVFTKNFGGGTQNQHIYITSDEEIKEENYSFYPPFGIGKNIVIDGELCFHIEAKDDKCMLHDAGLKPEQGRESCCKDDKAKKNLHYANLWATPKGYAVIEKFKKIVNIN